MKRHFHSHVRGRLENQGCSGPLRYQRLRLIVVAVKFPTLHGKDVFLTVYVGCRSATYIDGKKYVFAVQSREFYRYDDQAQPLVAQRAGTTLIFQPTPDVTMEVTLHYIRTPPTITTSVAEIIFGVDTLAFGGIAELYDSINFPDADGYHAKAQKFLQDDLNVLNTFGHNSGLMLTVSGFPYE